MTAHELMLQSGRSLHYVWPRSERSLYSEPKRLVELGWAKARARRSGRRETPEYSITPSGRRALRAWLSTPPAEPATEVEAVLRVVLADSGDVDDLRAALVASVQAIRAGLGERLVAQSRGYLENGGPFPDRLHIIGVVGDFGYRLIEMLEEWTEHALAEIDSWPSTEGVGMTDGARRTFERIIQRYGDD